MDGDQTEDGSTCKEDGADCHEKIKYHAREIDKLCAKRDMKMKKTTERYHKKTKGNKKRSKKRNNNCTCGNYIAKDKHWINYTNIDK